MVVIAGYSRAKAAVKASVALVRCPSYDQAQVDAAVQRSMDLLGGIERYVRRGNRVLLKVNLLVGAPPGRAVTTHPALVRAMIRTVRSAGGIPLVGDCSGFEGPSNPRRYFQACRQAAFEQVCAVEGAELVHMSAQSVEMDNPSGRAFRRFTLAKQVVDADVHITLPKLKTHGLTLFTGAVKNNFGCLPGLRKAQMHLRAQAVEHFSQMLVDLLLAVRPTLAVMDAVVGMEGNGPRNGRPRPIGALIASTDPVALDAIACQLVGLDPLMVPTTRLANEQSVGIGDLARIELHGDSLDDMQITDFQLPAGPEAFFRARGVWRFLQGRLIAKPVLVDERCTGCWICVDHCVAGALTRNARRPVFDYEKCIRCYCCQELCPHDAVHLRPPWLARTYARVSRK